MCKNYIENKNLSPKFYIIWLKIYLPLEPYWSYSHYKFGNINIEY